MNRIRPVFGVAALGLLCACPFELTYTGVYWPPESALPPAVDEGLVVQSLDVVLSGYCFVRDDDDTFQQGARRLWVWFKKRGECSSSENGLGGSDAGASVAFSPARGRFGITIRDYEYFERTEFMAALEEALSAAMSDSAELHDPTFRRTF